MNRNGVVCEVCPVAHFLRTPRKRRNSLAVRAAVMFSALPVFAFAGPDTGDLAGTARDAAHGNPVAGVQLTAHNIDKPADISTFTGSDGTFAFANLEPGQYEIAAVKNGFRRSSAHVKITANTTARVEFPLELAAAVPVTAGTTSPAPLTEREKLLLERIERLEARLSAVEASASTPRTDLVASVTPVVTMPSNSLPAAPTAPSAVPAPQPAAPAAPEHAVPEALEAPASTPGVDNFTPFAYGDFTWLNGTARTKTPAIDTKFFTPEIRFDSYFVTDFNQPKDHSMGGSTEVFRSGEFQLEQISVGGDFHWQNVRGRILTMNGLFAVTTPRNDGSAGVGQWDVRGAYKYVSEAYGGYHFDVNHGLNVDAGIFVSYIGLFSYYNFDNWTYQPSYVSSNTPWFFNGLRIQWFPTNKLKIEPWVINGWQSYNRFNGHHGFGGQIVYRPKEWLSLVFNNYGNGTDTLGNPARVRLHTDDSIEVRYFNRPESTGISKMAFSLTGDAGCEYGGGVTCHGGKGGPKQQFLGFMGYNRIWFKKDLFALTMGGGRMNNPGRYLTLIPPINGADAISGSPYFTENPGDKAHMWDANVNLQWMPRQYITWWFETGYRHADIPYFSGRGGITPPGGNNGLPSQFVCNTGASAGTNDLATARIYAAARHPSVRASW